MPSTSHRQIVALLLILSSIATTEVAQAADRTCGHDPALHRRVIGLSAMGRGVNFLGGDVCRWVNVPGVVPSVPPQKTVVTYSIVTGATENYSGQTLEAIVDANFIGAETINAIVEGVESWNDTAGITLRRVATGGQIRIGATTFGGGQVGLGGFSVESQGGPFYMTDGFVQLDKSDGNFTRNELRAVASHEMGHALGLNHSDLNSALMFPSVNSATGPTADDRWYMQHLYGSAPAKISATATQNSPVTLTIGRASPKQTGTSSNDTFENSAPASSGGPGKGTGSLTQNDVTLYILERAGPGGNTFAAINSNITAPVGGQNADPSLTHAQNAFDITDATVTTAGSYQYRVRAVHATAGNDILSDAVTIAINGGGGSVPAITSLLTATGTVGQSFSYTITASNTPTSFSAAPLPAGLFVDTTTGVISGTPTVEGVTQVTIGAANATGAGPTVTLVITINPVGGGGGGGGASPADLDGDGFINEVEELVGTSPTDATSTPFNGQPAGTPVQLAISKISIALNFSKPLKDSVQISGTFPFTAGASVPPQLLIADIGGILIGYDLNEKGASPSGFASKAKVGPKASKAGILKYSVKIGNETLAGGFEDENLANADVKNVSRTVIVTLYFNNTVFTTTRNLLYTAKTGKTGRAK